MIFNLIFFIVLTSVLLQGWSIKPVAKLFKLDTPLSTRKKTPIDFHLNEKSENELLDFIVPYNLKSLVIR